VASPVLDSLPDGVCVCNEDGYLLYTNSAEDRLFGYEPGELIGQHLTVQTSYQNSRDAMPRGGRLTITTTTAWLDSDCGTQYGVTIPAGRYIGLIVADTGHGMKPATQARIWEPFFTTKPFGRNTGLGVSMVYGAVKQSRGFVWAESEPGHGSVMKIYWPEVNVRSTPQEPS
jgi:nitrogen-specific signal transduction histidine kinase